MISDFGLFFRKQKEAFVATFTSVYSVTPKRVSERNIWYANQPVHRPAVAIYLESAFVCNVS